MRRTEEFAVFTRDHYRTYILPYSQLNTLQIKIEFVFNYLYPLGFETSFLLKNDLLIKS